MKVPVNVANIKLFECLSSETRIKVIELLGDTPKNIGELAEALGVSSAIMTRHISMLEDCGIVHSESLPGKRGLQKICSLTANEIILSFKNAVNKVKSNSVSIPVGQYSAYEVQPTCGLASGEKFIGICDDPRYFSSPDRVNAALLWFQAGWIEYCIPSYIFFDGPVSSIEISLEICSEFPAYNENWPSDISFYLNGTLLGTWMSPGDFGEKKGTYTPEWWRSGTQYGLLKRICITNKGTMLDGIYLSDVTIDKINMHPGKDSVLRISSPSDAPHPGGINIFGKGFGNYNQDIEIRVEYGEITL